jgi:hypothetical protein
MRYNDSSDVDQVVLVLDDARLWMNQTEYYRAVCVSLSLSVDAWTPYHIFPESRLQIDYNLWHNIYLTYNTILTALPASLAQL